ncbi:MAG: hypothetical protein ACLU37_03470 [Collinsella sp.]
MDDGRRSWVRAATACFVHLGNGSLAAIEDGCAATPRWSPPLDGLMMGTRCGSIDPATVLPAARGATYREVGDDEQAVCLLPSRASPTTPATSARAPGATSAACSPSICSPTRPCSRLAPVASMAGVDTIPLPPASAGTTGRSARPSATVWWLGVRIDNNKNREAVGNGPQVISTAGSAVTVMVIPTDEEYMIAHDVRRLTKNN